jgi:hypothetical protein
MDQEDWRAVAAAQEGLLSRRQLNALDVDRWRVRNQVAAGRWSERSSMVISTTTGPLSPSQMRWLGVLHAGPESVVGGLSAAEVAGLDNWTRIEVTVLIPDELEVDPVEGIEFHRTRRNIAALRQPGTGLPVCRLEPAILLFGAYQRSRRTAQGVVAAAVQQGLTDPTSLLAWVKQLRPLRWAPMFREVIADIAGGSQSVAELDVVRLCRHHGLALPDRQLKRVDADGRTRFTDCEWRLRDGRVIVLEVDGSFHMDIRHWEDDLVRQRQLTSSDRLVVRCTARELREQPARVARDLRRLGVPSRAA